MRKKIILPMMVLAMISAWAADGDSSALPERYQTIVDRQMFGTPPAGFDPSKPPSEVSKSAVKELTKEEEQLKSSIHFSIINITPDGEVAVGFTDNSDSKNPKGYYLKVGEKKDGWLVKEADPTAATMTIAKGELEVSLELGSDSSKNASANSKANGNGAQANGGEGGKGSGMRAPKLNSLRERRLSKRKEHEEERAQRDKEYAEKEAQRQQELKLLRDDIAQRQQEDERRQIEEEERAQREKERDAEQQKRFDELAKRVEEAEKKNAESNNGESDEGDENDDN